MKGEEETCGAEISGIQGIKIPLAFTRQKLPVLFDLFLKLFDLKSIQLLRRHIDKVKQFLDINDSIDPFIVDDHFIDALTHLLCPPAANPKMGQSLSLFAFIDVDHTINDKCQHRMSLNRSDGLLRVLQQMIPLLELSESPILNL